LYKPLIVGVDPGANIGIAIFDFKGNIVSIYTQKHASKNDIIKRIFEFGKPLIVATDVNPVPHMVKRIASMTSSRTFFPEKSMTTKEKNKLVGRFREIKDIHVKDAFAAGYKAFKTYRGLLNKVEVDLADKHMEYLYESIVDSLIRKKSFNIKEAVEKFSGKSS
jgi:uncharacterized protein